MLKDYLVENQKSMYWLAEKSNVPYSTVNDLANGRIDIRNCRAGALKQLADALSLTMDALYDLCSSDITICPASCDSPVRIRIRGKKYYAEFSDHGQPVSLEVCPVRQDTAYFIRSLAEWAVEDYFENQEWEAANALLAHA